MISTETSRNSYTGNGSTTVFAYAFKIFASADLKVYVDGVLKTITTNYTLSGVGVSSGGNVTFLTAPANGTKVEIVRRIELKQLVDYVENDNFPAATHEDTLDKIVQQVQMLKDIMTQNFITDSPSFSRTSVKFTGTQVIGASATGKITLNTKNYDILNEFDAVTNYRFTPLAAGGYLVIANVDMANTDNGFYTGYITQTTAGNYIANQRTRASNSPDGAEMSLSAIANLIVGDYLDLSVSNATSTTVDVIMAKMEIIRLW